MEPQIARSRTIVRGLALGAALVLAAPGGLAAQAGCGDAVTVDRGDTLAGIAATCGVQLGAILEANPGIEDPNIIRVGQRIEIPGGGDEVDRPDPDEPSQPRGRTVHAVEPGETLAGIAGRYGVALQAILSINPDIEDPNVIRVGQRIEIPGERRSRTDPPDRPRRDAPPERRDDPEDESVSVSPRSAPVGSEVTLRGSGFEPDDRLEVGVGPPRSEYEVVGHARVGPRGTVRVDVEIPSWVQAGRPYVFVLSSTTYREEKAISGPVTVRSGEPEDPAGPGRDIVMVVGRLTDEGVECQALRTDDDELYTLAGDLGRFDDGDRVQVKGRVAEVSVCMQGTTLEVESVAPPGRDPDNLQKVLRLRGRLEAGTECTILRARDGVPYALVGDLEDFGPGDEVRIEGTRTDVSYCMEGEATLEVSSIEGG